MDPDMILVNSKGQDLTPALGIIAGDSHQALPHYSQVSSPASLHCSGFLSLSTFYYFLAHLSVTWGLWVYAVVSGVLCIGMLIKQHDSSDKGLPPRI